MNQINHFINYLAYAGLLISSFWLIGCIWSTIKYEGSLKQQLDKCSGLTITFPIRVPSIIFIVCLCWVMAA